MTEKEFNKLFAYLISHEFKTPLTTIFGFAQLLQKSYNPAWNQEIVRQAIRMNLILDQAVVLNRLYHGNLQLSKQKLFLRETLQASINRLKLAYPKVEVSVTKGDFALHADEAKLQNVLLDLLLRAAVSSKITIKIVNKKIFMPVGKLQIPKLEEVKLADDANLWVDSQLVEKFGGKLQVKGKMVILDFTP